MNILITGSTGFIASSLIPFLTTQGHRITRLVRTKSKSGENEVQWNPEAGTIDKDGLKGVDAVVHLAGENIGAGRWTAKKKEKILNS
jgi:NAD dependent epimerase/dehydratase family enzyme